MPAPTINLTGEAQMGFIWPGMTRPQRRHLMLAPSTVKLGRCPAEAKKGVPLLQEFLPAEAAWEPPAKSDYTTFAAESITRMFGNDRWGDCVIADRAHSLGLWTANATAGEGEVIPTDAEVVSEYHRICGPGDEGCVITRVLDEGMKNGFHFAGRTHKIAGYVKLDGKNPRLLKAAQHLFGAICVGVYFRQAWSGQSVWGITNSPVVGGHDIGGAAYDEKGLVVMSWGRLYVIPWEVLARPDYCDELYAVLSPDWMNATGVAPSGLDVAGLERALAKLAQGDVPDPPTPPDPPPEPPVTHFHGIGKLVASEPGGPLDRIIFDGAVGGDGPDEPPTPVVPPGDPHTVDCGTALAAVVMAGMLFPVPGVSVMRKGASVSIRKDGITPEGWAAIIHIVELILEALGPLIHGEGTGLKASTQPPK